MSAPLLLADHLTKGCNEACARAITGLLRVVIRISWQYLHWWTLVIISPFLVLAGWLRSRE